MNLQAIEPTRSRGQHRVDGVRRPKYISTQAAGGPFEHGDWESPYPLPYHCDDPCVILEPRLRPAARAAMLDCVLNLLVQPLITVRFGVLEGGIASMLFEVV